MNELLFVLLVLVSLIVVGIIGAMAARRRWSAARRMGWVLGASWAVYLVVVFAVAAATPQHIFVMNQERCFDEMCFSAVHVESVAQLGPASRPVRAAGRFYVVALRVTCRSRGRAQSEGGLHPLLWDSGRRFQVSREGMRAWQESNGRTAGLTDRLGPGESVVSVQIFDAPPDLRAPGLILTHGFTPGYFVIGECPLFHQPTIMRLDPSYSR